MINIAPMLASFTLDYRKFVASTQKMGKEITALNKRFLGLGKQGLSKFGGSMNVMKKSVKGLAGSILSLKNVAIAGFAGWGLGRLASSVVKVGASFQRSMTVVRGVTQATSQQLEQMTEIARRMGATTEFSASQAADSLKFLGLAGLSVDQAIGALPGTLDLATAGQLELGRAADIATNILTQMELKVEDLTRVNDALVTVQSTANTNVDQAATAWVYAGTKANAFGVEVEELGAMIGILANSGIRATMAGTTLRQAMIRLLDPTSDTEAILEKYNIQVVKADGSLRSFTDILLEMADAQMSTVEITKLFGARAGNIEVIINKGSAAIREYIEEIENSAGASKDLADLFRSDFIGIWDSFRSSIEETAQILFTEYGPALASAMKATTDFLRDINKELRLQQIGKQFEEAFVPSGLEGAVKRTFSAITKSIEQASDASNKFLEISGGIRFNQEKIWRDIGILVEQASVINQDYEDTLKAVGETGTKALGEVENAIKKLGGASNETFKALAKLAIEAFKAEAEAAIMAAEIKAELDVKAIKQAEKNEKYILDINKKIMKMYSKDQKKVLDLEMKKYGEMAEVMEDFYTTNKEVSKKTRDEILKQNRTYSGTMKALYKDLNKDMVEGSNQSVGRIVDNFIAGENMKQSVASVTADFISDAAGRGASMAYNKAIEKIIALIGAMLGQGAAGSGAQGALVGGVGGALVEIALYLGTGVAAMLGGKAMANQFRATGGWIGEHPEGGIIKMGSGLKDDVFLGDTPKARHWGMKGEFVINKEATARHRGVLEAINNRYYEEGAYVNYEGSQIPWHGTADALALGAGMSFVHGFYKGAGPISGLIEAAIFIASAIPSMFAGKALSNKFSSSGGHINEEHGFGGFIGDFLGGVADVVGDLVGWIPGIGPIIEEDLKALGNYFEKRGDWLDEWTDPDAAWERILELIRTPLEAVSRDLVTPNKYYSDPLDTISTIFDFLKRELEPERTLIEELISFGKGSSFVPYTGPAMVHEGERIFSVDDNKALINAIGNTNQDKEVHFHLHGIVTTDNVDQWVSDRMEAVKQKTIGTQYQPQELWSVGINI